MNDSQLLERFVAGQDQAAFRSLVVRHGPRVLRACRSTLRDHHDVEDAFQATFLVFVRRAPSIRDPERLGNWFIGVANRVASRARRDAARRRQREAGGVEMIAECLPPAPENADLRGVLREEMGRLPAEYRDPLQLCYLEGLTHEQAARRLGWPAGTVKVRLVRARRLLRERLERRGVALGMLLLILLPRGARGELSPALVDSTVDAMRFAAAGRAMIPGSCHARASALSARVRITKLGRRLRWAAPAILALALLATGFTRLSGRFWVVDGDEVAAIPANLMDVLNVRCR